MKRISLVFFLAIVLVLVVACATPTTAPSPASSSSQAASVSSSSVASSSSAPSSSVAQATVAPTKPASSASSSASQSAAASSASAASSSAQSAASSSSAAKPKSGGKFVIAYTTEPETMDPHKSRNGGREIGAVGATLVAKDPNTGDYVPYLAKSWKASADGLVWEFALRDDVKFHDGTSLKAKDFVYSFNRALDPNTKSPGAARALGSLKSAEAVGDYTLRLTLSAPYYPFLESLELGFTQPLLQSAVEKWGDQYGRHPVGVGPWKFKEWLTGDRMVFERNPDFKWAPSFMKNSGAPYIETVEYRYIPEYAAALAGLEAGQIDFFDVSPQDVARLKASGKVQVFEAYMGGMLPYVSMNLVKSPFDNLQVRQAMNYAVDKDALIKIVLGGAGVPQYGPISFSTHGYWKGIEQIGYKFDLTKAKSLMGEAGYKSGSDGILAKDGKPLQLTLNAASVAPFDKVAEVLQQQYKALGIDVKIQLVDAATLAGAASKGNYEFSIGGFDYTEFDVIPVFFHSSGVGGLNYSQLKDPTLDKLLEATRSETDAAKRQAQVDAAQKRIVEQAYVVPLLTAKSFLTLSSRVKGASIETFSVMGNRLYLNDLYFDQ